MQSEIHKPENDGISLEEESALKARQALLKKFASRKTSGSLALAEALLENNITHVFSVSGTPVDFILTNCVKLGIRVIGNRNQQGAVLASIAFNYMKGGIKSAVVVSAGPAVTNCATGLLVAHDNQWPLLVIGGRRSELHHTLGNFQQLDGAALFKSICKSTRTITSAGTIRQKISSACKAVMKMPAGPVYIDVTEDALCGKEESRHRIQTEPSDTKSPQIPSSLLSPVIDMLKAAKRPSLIAGNALRWSVSWESLRFFVESLEIPFATTPMAKGFLPDGHSLDFSRVRAAMVADSDLVIIAGTQLDWITRFGSEIPRGTRIVFLHHVASHAKADNLYSLIHDAGASLNQIVQASREDHSSPPDQDCIKADWLANLTKLRLEKMRHISSLCQQEEDSLTPFNCMAVIKNIIPPDAITVIDGNSSMQAAQAVLMANTPVTRMTAAHNGCMGTGIPFAIGSQLATGKTVVLITGDFALGLNIIELETAARSAVPIIIILINNSGNGGSTRQSKYFGKEHPERISQFQDNLAYEQVMQNLGGTGYIASTAEEITRALKTALVNRKPALINILVNPAIGLMEL